MRAIVRAIGVGATSFTWAMASAGHVMAADATSSPTAGVSAVGESSILSGQLIALIAIVLIAAAVVSVAMVLWFARDALQRYYSTAERFARQGIATEPVVVTAEGPAEGEALAGETPTISVSGPPSVVLGQPATYKATFSPADLVLGWSAEPEGGGAFNPSTGATVQFVAAKSGVVKVTATGGAVHASLDVAVIAAKEAVKLPFIGRGWGGIAVGLVAVFVVFGLGLAGRLGSEALATLFGGLLGVGAAKAVSGSSDKDES